MAPNRERNDAAEWGPGAAPTGRRWKRFVPMTAPR